MPVSYFEEKDNENCESKCYFNRKRKNGISNDSTRYKYSSHNLEAVITRDSYGTRPTVINKDNNQKYNNITITGNITIIKAIISTGSPLSGKVHQYFLLNNIGPSCKNNEIISDLLSYHSRKQDTNICCNGN